MKTSQTFSTIALSLALVLAASGACFGQSGGEATRGTPGVATRRAVVNFAELARQSRSPDGAMPDVDPATSEGFTPARPGGTPPLPEPASGFVALEDDGFPDVPDTHGAVGPNHLMVALKSGYRIQDRSGEVISTVKSSNFWAAVGPFNSFTYDGKVLADIHDPRVLFDPYGERFMLIEMANSRQVANACLLVGLSQTSDPTGNWNLYRIDADPANLLYLDHPNVGFNKDWIVVQVLTFGAASASRVYVFNKTNFYSGGAGFFTLLAAPTTEQFLQPATTFDPSLPTVYLLGQTGTGTSLNSLRLYTITGPIGSEALTVGSTITTTNRWDFTAPGGWAAAFAPQLGAAKRFGILGAGIHSLVYRNGSLWAAHHIFVPAGGAATRSSVQWWQVSPQGAIIQRGLIDDPTGLNFYGIPASR